MQPGGLQGASHQQPEAAGAGASPEPAPPSWPTSPRHPHSAAGTYRAPAPTPWCPGAPAGRRPRTQRGARLRLPRHPPALLPPAQRGLRAPGGRTGSPSSAPRTGQREGRTGRGGGGAGRGGGLAPGAAAGPGRARPGRSRNRSEQQQRAGSRFQPAALASQSAACLSQGPSDSPVN